jgi:hypothetical protein
MVILRAVCYLYFIALTQLMEGSMKFQTRFIFSLFVVIAIAGSIAVPVQAFKAPNNGVGDPIVTGITGDMDFNAAIVEPTKMPGTESYKQMTVPAGSSGALQFHGKGLLISGVSLGTEQACFSFDIGNSGWDGSVYQWNGIKWAKLATSFTDNGEGKTSACATIYGDGYYALLIGLTGKPAVKAGSGEPEGYSCASITSVVLTFDSNSGGTSYYDVTINADFPDGAYISYDYWGFHFAGEVNFEGMFPHDGNTNNDGSFTSGTVTFDKRAGFIDATFGGGDTMDLSIGVGIYTYPGFSGSCVITNVPVPSNGL